MFPYSKLSIDIFSIASVVFASPDSQNSTIWNYLLTYLLEICISNWAQYGYIHWKHHVNSFVVSKSHTKKYSLEMTHFSFHVCTVCACFDPISSNLIQIWSNWSYTAKIVVYYRYHRCLNKYYNYHVSK